MNVSGEYFQYINVSKQYKWDRLSQYFIVFFNIFENITSNCFITVHVITYFMMKSFKI